MRTEIQDIQQAIEILKDHRKMQGITQADMADFSGLHRKAIGKIEGHGADPRLSSFLKLAQLLGIKVILETHEESR